MSEAVKTGVFVGVALVLAAAAMIARPTIDEVSIEDEVGREFFPDFTDPLAAASLEIIEHDAATASRRAFKVAKVDGVWAIPSHENYPTDAANQLAQAAASVIDLKKLGVAGQQREDHEQFGVVDPDSDEGSEGVGKKVILADEGGQVLAQFVIGKEVKDQSELRYVRVPGQNVVFRVKVDTSKLSTKFEDWIEDDLLKLNSFDIRNVTLNNYSIDEVQGKVVRGDRLELTYNDTDSKWQLEGLAEGEELETSKLSSLRTALDDLKIVDVRRKPAGLSRDLRSAEGIELSPEVRLSLQSRGFFFTPDGQLLSNEGEAVCTLKDGVRYVLRFGEIAVGTGGGTSGDEPEQPDESDDPPAVPQGSNRYIFVTAQFDPDMIAKPELTPLPPVKDAEESESDTAKPDQAEGADQDDNGKAQGGDNQNEAETTGGDDKARPSSGPDEGDEQADDSSEKAGEADVPSEDDADAERKRIEEENKRKTDEYDEKVKAARDKVKELNDRFADWYYVISDEVYQKIHLSRDAVVKKKETEEDEETAADEATPPVTPDPQETQPEADAADDDAPTADAPESTPEPTEPKQ